MIIQPTETPVKYFGKPRKDPDVVFMSLGGRQIGWYEFQDGGVVLYPNHFSLFEKLIHADKENLKKFSSERACRRWVERTVEQWLVLIHRDRFANEATK